MPRSLILIALVASVLWINYHTVLVSFDPLPTTKIACISKRDALGSYTHIGCMTITNPKNRATYLVGIAPIDNRYYPNEGDVYYIQENDGNNQFTVTKVSLVGKRPPRTILYLPRIAS